MLFAHFKRVFFMTKSNHSFLESDFNVFWPTESDKIVILNSVER